MNEYHSWSGEVNNGMYTGKDFHPSEPNNLAPIVYANLSTSDKKDKKGHRSGINHGF